jgi:gamma-glutamyl-gamma-aminobutyrate hydrolase PuuD
VEDADLVQFTGGEDVSPQLYGETEHPRTSSNMRRDVLEIGMFVRAGHEGKPMAGICRGAQFLHVMMGGDLWQDVPSHAISGTHEATCMLTKKKVQVTSTHHQMMVYSDVPFVLLDTFRSAWKESNHNGFSIRATPKTKGHVWRDMEALAYLKGEGPRVLCFQPHPEYTNCPKVTTELYFVYIDLLLGRNEYALERKED